MRTLRTQRVISLLLCLAMCWVLLPASYAEMPTSAEVKASGENTAPPAENENETRTADSAENKAEDNMIPTAGDVFSNEEGKELTASETQIGEDTEEVLATREPVEVRFVLEPAETVLTVYDPAQLDEQGCSRIISPEKEGNYLLFSGTYLIDAVCDGCIPILQQTVKISPDLWEIPIVLTRMEESAENKAPEEEREVMFEEMKSASEVTAVPGESVLQATIPHEEKQTDREIAENPADGEKEENEIQPAAISPLIVTVQPTDYVGKIGENATFTVVAEGDGIKYQWQVKTSDNAAWKNTKIYGYFTATITVPITAARNNYQYRCVLTQGEQTETSESARLTALPSLVITSQPTDYVGRLGENATFAVAAVGEGIRYQWQVKTSDAAAWKNTTINGYRTAAITVPITAARSNYRYRCVLTQGGGAETSGSASLTALPSLVITSQPTDYSGKIGENATFTVVAEGDGIKYQWQVKTSDNAAWKNTTIYGYRTAKATVPITAARNNYQYRCVLTQEGIEETTEAARLTVIPAVRITQQPEDQAGFIGENATFSVAAEGEGIRYQWQVKSSEKAAWKNTTIRGYQTAMITVPIAKERDGFQYRCLLTGEEGIRVTSNSAQLTIAEIPYCAPMLTIIDDDGDYHFMTDVLPLIQELQVPIATAVTPLRIGSKTRWMSWDDIAYCAANGAEVLCHTYSHYSGSEIVNIDDETIVRQYGLARDCMIERGYNGDILVYSSSTGNIQRVREDAAQVFQCGIKIGGNSVNNRLTDRYALNRCRIDYAETEGKTSWNRDDILQYIDDVAEQGGWQIFMFHTSNSMWRQRALLDENGEVVRGENGAPIPMTDKDGNPVLDSRGEHPTMGTEYYLPMLREAILYARERGVAILTAENAYRILYSEE